MNVPADRAVRANFYDCVGCPYVAADDTARTINAFDDRLQIDLKRSTIAWDGRTIGKRPQWAKLLGALAYQESRIVSVDRLTLALWQGEEPDQSAEMVRSLIHRVRRALVVANVGLLIRTCHRSGYMLHLDEAPAEISVKHSVAAQAMSNAVVRSSCGTFTHATKQGSKIDLTSSRGTLTIDLVKSSVCWNNEMLRTTRKCCSVLTVLAERPFKFASIEDISERVWGSVRPKDTGNAIRVMVYTLRQALKWADVDFDIRCRTHVGYGLFMNSGLVETNT